MIDYKKAKDRLRPTPYHFKPELDDDFFGFSSSLKTTWYEKAGYTLITLAVGYYIYQAVTFIIANGLQL